MNKMSIQLPKELLTYQTTLEKTIKPSVSIKAIKRKTTPFESKFGGNPYLPKGLEHPKDEWGNPMRLLAQINFKELPKLEHLPEHGILQFYLSQQDDMMGLDFDNPTNQKNFRVLYHKEVIEDEQELVDNFSYIEEVDECYLPLNDEMGLEFSKKVEPVSLNDFQFHTLIDEEMDLEQNIQEGRDRTLWDVYSDYYGGEGHKVGGYAFFTQEDPRGYGEGLEEYKILLLQIDTDDDNDIMWGDCGVGNFFIKEEDLKNQDFSKVLFNWDCC